MKQIGFVGLGMMGFPMAGRLVAAGMNVLAYDVVAETRERFAAEHKAARAAADLQEFGDCDVVVTMLPDSAIVDEAVLKLTKALQRGALVVDMSSADPVRTRTLSAAVKAVG